MLNYCSIVIIVLFPWVANISVSLNYKDIQFLDLSDDCKVTAALGLNGTLDLVLASGNFEKDVFYFSAQFMEIPKLVF